MEKRKNFVMRDIVKVCSRNTNTAVAIIVQMMLRVSLELIISAYQKLE